MGCELASRHCQRKVINLCYLNATRICSICFLQFQYVTPSCGASGVFVFTVVLFGGGGGAFEELLFFILLAAL